MHWPLPCCLPPVHLARRPQPKGLWPPAFHAGRVVWGIAGVPRLVAADGASMQGLEPGCWHPGQPLVGLV